MKLSFYGQKQAPSTLSDAEPVPKEQYTITQHRDLNSKREFIEVAAEEVVELDFSDGSSWLLGPEDLTHLTGEQDRAVTSDQVIDLSRQLSFGAQGRSLGRLILKGLRIFKKPVAKVTATWAAEKIEGKLITKEGLYRVTQDFSLLPVQSVEMAAGDQPVLLFIHGTASSFTGSFGQLKNSDLWTRLHGKYKGKIYAFDHYTLSKSPVQNVLDVLPYLPTGTRLDLVTQSRGGIVGDFLARIATESSAFTAKEIALVEGTDFAAEAELLKKLNELAKKHKLTVEKYVRVACPSQGTTLMTNRLDLLLNVLLNLMSKVSGADALPALAAIKELLLATISQRTNPLVLPGLAAMQPDTGFQLLLNSSHTKLSSELSIIAGAHGRGNWKESLMHIVTQAFFQGDNDYVIDEKYKYAGFPRSRPTYYRLFKGGKVHHFRYFLNEDSREAIWEALNAKAGSAPRDFSEVEKDKKNSLKRAGRKEEIAIANPYARVAAWVEHSDETGYSPEATSDLVNVTLKAGHMKYANYPIMVGHFQDDGIVSAESVLNSLLGNKLSKSHRLGNYPGAPETSKIISPNSAHKLAAIIVGLGVPENLSSMVLAKTVEKACLKYQEDRAEHGHEVDAPLGITPLMIGSGYGNLTLSASINAILEGVFSANRKVRAIQKMATTAENDQGEEQSQNLPLITEVEFVEIYRNKALRAFYILHNLDRDNNHFNIAFSGKLETVQGSRDLLPMGEEKNWWMRLAIHYDELDDSFNYSASTGRARVSNRITRIRRSSIHRLLKDSDFESEWNRRVSRTLFEMLVPNDFKLAFRNQKNILLVLDKAMAEYPWELVHYDKESGAPLCTRTGFIRQLATKYDRPVRNQVYEQTALVVGDPQLHGKYPQLPGALEEAKQVENLLRTTDFEVNFLKQPSFQSFLMEFFVPYKLVHIASHGVFDYLVNGRKETGILLENDEVITTDYIQQLSNTAEFVFLNCCHLGKVDSSKEAYTQSRSQLAANLGTQFIENGVKAVIVAGWAVDDAAAQEFAKVFYTKMIAGYNFGKAVKEARAECYRLHPHTNTWGAYQCYGDQFYTLISRRQKRGENELRYLLPNEVVIDLERLLDDTRSVRKRKDDLKGRLEEIVAAIDKKEKNLCTPPVVELKAAVYAELGAYAEASEAYHSLWAMSPANWEFRSLEQYYQVSLAASWQKYVSGEEPNKKIVYDSMKEPLKNAEALLKNFGSTNERRHLVGIAHQQCYLAATPSKRKYHLKKALDYYDQARKAVKEPMQEDDYYHLCNWLSIAAFADQDGVKKFLSGSPLLKKVQGYVKQLSHPLNVRTEFWDEVRYVNALIVLLLVDSKQRSIATTVSTIKEHYQQAWNVGGSTRNRDSEVLQVTFLLQMLEDIEKAGKIKYDLQKKSLGELCTFFKTLE